jgi:mannose/fructose/N-acetylgalactosamine-specific phosphotransferase system component IIB
VLVSDQVAGDEFEQALYRAAVPADVELVVLPVAGAARAIATLPEKKSICLVGSLADALALVEQGLPVDAVNVGGLHAGPGRIPVLPFVWLGPDDAAVVRRLAARGERVEARMLPGGDCYDLGALAHQATGAGG